MSDAPLRAACLCGAVRLEADPPSKFLAHCHCENCRRAHGAAFVTWIGFPRAAFRVAGGADELARYATDTGATRSFCRRCGSTLLYESPRWPDDVHVAAGALLDPPDRAPGAHVYADRAVGWCALADELPRYGGPDGTTPL